jgi:diguanylate cyclase (GGDEF)-like protein/PAS domain S-box-containing protein
MPDRSLYEVLADRVVGFSSLSSVDQVQTHLCEAALELSDMSTALVARYNRAGGMYVAAHAGPLAKVLSRLEPAQLEQVSDWVEHGTSCYFAGGTASTAHEFFVRAGTGSALVLPLTTRGSRGGVLVVADRQVVTCSPDRVQLLEQLAAHGAATLQSVETVGTLRRLALTDALTGAGNSAAFDDYINAFEEATEPHAVCVVDIDHFKQVNDTFGHVAGDRMLCEVADNLVRAAGPHGRVFRVGGDEFVLVVPARDEAAAASFGASLCDEARESDRFTISVGIAVTQRLDRAAVALADTALYQVKRRGRDGFQIGRNAEAAEDAPESSQDAVWAVPTSLAEEVHEVVFTTDASGRWTFLNRAWDELVGVASDDSLGRVLFDWVHDDDVEACVAGFEDLWAGETDALRTELRWTTAAGGTRWFELWARPLHTPKGAVIGAAGTLTDVTTRRAAEDALRRQLGFSTVITRVLERFASLERDSVDDGIDEALEQVGRFAGVDRSYLFRFSGDSTTTSNTHEWCADGVEPQIHNLQDVPVTLFDEWLPSLRNGRAVHIPRVADLPASLAELGENLREQVIQSLVIVPLLAGTRLIGFLGFDAVRAERCWSEQEIDLLRTVANALVSVVSRHEATEQLTRQALLDPLTGLPNRATFHACVQQALAGSSSRPGMVAVIFADLDGFKLINDSLDHDAGDEVLKTAVQRVSATLRSGDVLARLGADQFTVVCADIDGADAAVQIAERFADAIRQPTMVGDAHLYVTASIGIAIAGDRSTATSLLQDADTAMRLAKRQGRNRIEVFTDELRTDVGQRMPITTDLRHALDDGDLHLLYQPIVHLETGHVVAAEALVRWEHPQRGHILPTEFIDVAEKTGLIGGLGRWVLLHACRELAAWHAVGLDDLAISVNLSAQQLNDDGLIDTVAEATARAGIPAHALTIELTESTLMADTAHTLGILRALKDLGVRLSIDDFGTGFSSLSYLKRFPVDEVKIDRSFVDGLGADAENTAIVTAIHSLAHALGLDVVAEGVESDAQRRALIELGCETAQGYLFSRPVAGDALIPTIAALQPRRTGAARR